MLIRWVDVFIAPSAFIGRMLIRAGIPESRVHVVSYGVDVQPYVPSAHEFALFVGRLSPEKGVDTLVAAASRARVPLTIAGDGPLRAELQRELPDHVKIVGHVESVQLEALRRGAAFAVVPSECEENCSISALESLAAGRPVLVTRVGGLPEIVRDGREGVVVEPGNVPALSDAMTRLWADARLSAALGRAGWERASDKFERVGQTKKLVQVYQCARN
jgi:glycosyltransferase involved in cell wall biosynthesis